MLGDLQKLILPGNPPKHNPFFSGGPKIISPRTTTAGTGSPKICPGESGGRSLFYFILQYYPFQDELVSSSGQEKSDLQNQTEPLKKTEQCDKPADTNLTIDNELESEPLVRFNPAIKMDP